METIDNTEEQKKSGYAALREKHQQEMSALQAKYEAEVAARAADKKSYFGDIMKSRGYEGDFNEFADKYSSLDINDMVSLYEGQHGKPAVSPTQPTEQTTTEQIGARSVIAGANPTTEVGGVKFNEMSVDQLVQFGTQHFK